MQIKYKLNPNIQGQLVFYDYCQPVNSLILVYLQVSEVVYLHNLN